MAPGAYHRGTRVDFEHGHRLDVSRVVRELNHAWFAHASEVK